MKKVYLIIAALLVFSGQIARAQTTPPPPQRPAQPQPGQPAQQPSRQAIFDLTEYGVQIKPDPRLIAVMAALEAAGFDPTPEGEDPSVFRAQLRRDLANLDSGLRQRLVSFYERNKLRRGADGREPTPAEQAARYVSLAYALGPAPGLEEPARSLELPAGLLEVLDFAPLVREFYRRSGIDERMPSYLRAYQEEGNRLRRSTIGMVRSVVAYLNTRPITTTIERIPTRPPAGDKRKKDAPQTYTTREITRKFFIVPDLLAAPGAINFRVIADDYSVVVPYCDETKRYCPGRDDNPASPEVRRAYIQYVIDPLVVRFNRDISARKEQLKQLLDARTTTGANVSPDVFLMVARSLVTAIDVRLDEALKLEALSREASSRLDKTTDARLRAEIVKELEAARAGLADEVVAQLAEGYEGGALLAFYFAEQLRGVAASGFDISNSLPDMIASFDPARETRRLEEADAARKRAALARKARQEQTAASATTAAVALPNAALVKKLLDVDKLVQLKNYAAAEERLLALLVEFPDEARVYFALAETASLSARDATDEDVQAQRLNKALVNYRNAVRVATDATDRCLLTRAHEAMGRILEFLDQGMEALKAFEAAIKINDTSCGAHRTALEGKRRLAQPQ
jgi:tetratricopeptide (TPR) repeat protein